MKKILFILFAAMLIGCSAPNAEMEKDKTFLRNTGLKYEHVLLNWNEPSEVKYLNTEKFIGVWDRGAGFGAGYQVRILFDHTKAIYWTMEERNLDKIISNEISTSK